jgi:hypothetical protein
VAGIINICGAIGDTAWIDAGDIPVLSFHGDADQVVPYGTDEITLVGLYPLLTVHGSASVSERADEMGIEYCFEKYEGQDHTPHVDGSQTSQYYDTTLNISRNFLAKYVCGDATNCSYGPTITSVNDLKEVNNLISIYPNPATDFAEILFNENNYGSEFNLYDIHGKLISSQTITGTKITLNRNNLPNGIYFIRITNGEKVQTSKLIFE